MTDSQNFFAAAPKGVVPILADELRAQGADGVKEQPAGVVFNGTLETAYRACLWSRTASRILMPLAEFEAGTPEALYAGVQTIDWSKHMAAEGTLAVDCSVRSSAITHSHYAALKVKDAIADQFRDACGERPSVEMERPDIRVNLYLFRDKATLSLDLSGDSLHRRGYRQDNVPAPLKENLAAAILLRLGWPEIAAQAGCLVDPMCGSGTFAIEAAMIAADIAPGLLRDYYGFLGWRGHDAALWQRLQNEAQGRREQGLERLPPISGYDLSRKAVAAAQTNVAAAGLDEHIRIACRDLAELKAPAGCESGLVVVNPPYGERLGEKESLGSLYAMLGQTLKQEFLGWKAGVLTSEPDLARQMMLSPRRSHVMYNGALECKLLRIEVEPKWFQDSNALRGPRPLASEELTAGAEMFANRLRKNLKELGRWARREGVDCYRLYDADMPEYALAVDLYHGEQLWVHAQEYEAPKSIDAAKARLRLREALTVIMQVLEVPQDQVYVKVRKRQKGSAQYEKQAGEQAFFEIRENGCRFWVNFADYLDTGLFLDHRNTRAMVGEMAKGTRFLNLFAYTGTATVYAAQGGAKSTTTVDMSNTYLDWARRNLQLNGFREDRHQLIQADCLKWLAEQAKGPWGGGRYDLIFLDPPTFSTSKRMQETFDVQRDHVDLIRKAVALLAPGGTLVFSNNFRKFKLDEAALADLAIEEVSDRTVPKDFARNRKIHRCWKIRRK